MWDRVFMSCGRDGVFKNVQVLQLTPEQLDAYCEAEGVVWEQTGEKTAHIHGCGINCYCHGGLENTALRPRPI